MSGLTRIESNFYEQVPYELGRIADSLEKLVSSKEPKTEVPNEEPVKEEHPTDSQFDVLAVTSVRVYPFKDDASLEHVKAYATIVLNDQIRIRGLRVMEGVNGLFVGYPTDPFYKGDDFRSVVTPITRQLREHIENCVLEKYQEITK